MEFRVREKLGGYFPEDDFEKQEFFCYYLISLNDVEKRKTDLAQTLANAEKGGNKRSRRGR